MRQRAQDVAERTGVVAAYRLVPVGGLAQDVEARRDQHLERVEARLGAGLGGGVEEEVGRVRVGRRDGAGLDEDGDEQGPDEERARHRGR